VSPARTTIVRTPTSPGRLARGFGAFGLMQA
jgi:hypothetical protein